MRQFKYSKSLKIFIYFFSPAMIALFVWALFQYNHQQKLIYFAVILPVSLGMIGLFSYGLADVIIGTFYIDSDRVILKSPIGSHSLTLNEIRGFRTDANYIRVIPVDLSRKAEMKISTYMNDTDHIVEWLCANYPDLDQLEGDEEERQVLENEEVGLTKEARMTKLKEARRIAKLLNGGSFALIFFPFIFPSYYSYTILICCIYPFVAIGVSLAYREIISADEYKDSKMPSLGTAFILPGIMLCLLAIIDYTLLEYPVLLWISISLISVSLTIMYTLPSFRSVSKPRQIYVTAIVLLFLNCFYGYGLFVEVNCRLDEMPPARYKTQVSGKHISKGKTTIYYIELSPWGARKQGKETKVSRKEYDLIAPGDTVIVAEHTGYLKIQWIEIEL